ncbi:MAG: thermonuclease family protein [Proteobacteria bacterium]|nr:thermonuclease family protein [Pseudomonadota bacterium]
MPSDQIIDGVFFLRNHLISKALAQIDTPEKSQDFGQVSKQALSDLVYGKDVTIEVETIDKYGRRSARCWSAGWMRTCSRVDCAGSAWEPEMVAAFNVLTGWYGLPAREDGFAPLSIAEFNL